MTSMRWWAGAAAAAALAAGTPARAALDAATFKTFGGTYMSDCGNNVSAKVTVFEDVIVFLDGAKRIAGSNVQSAPSYFGQDMPSEYRTALLGDVPGGAQLIAVVSRDEAGYYVTLDGDARVMAQIGKPLAAMKYRRCGPGAGNPSTAAAPSSAATPAPASSAAVDAGGMLLNPKFRAAYYRALGAKVKEQWLATLDGPSPPTRRVTVADREYVLVSSCRNHDCADNNAVLLYSSEFQIVYGKIYQRGRSSLIGVPPAGVARELDRLWRVEWRQGR
jgi:hypothetical protein